MKKIVFLLLFVAIGGQQAYAWGFWAHRRINRLAVFTLPPEMLGCFKNNIDYLTEHAVDPDARRYAVDGEAPRHFIDVDHYGEYPFDMMPRTWDEAVEKYTEDTLLAYGIVPWNVTNFYYRLVNAFKDKNLPRILKTAADLGHYVADNNVPLHTTENYNGQMTGQKGIHGLWESRIPEVFGDNFDYFVGPAEYVEDPLTLAWKGVLEAHICLDSVFGFEEAVTNDMPSDQKFSYEVRGNTQVRVYSYEFVNEYHRRLAGQVERRIRASVSRVGAYWYSAWVDAGQPDLSEFSGEKIEEEVEEYEKRIKIIDRESQDIGAIDWIEEFFGTCCHRGGNKTGHDHAGCSNHLHEAIGANPEPSISVWESLAMGILGVSFWATWMA